MADVFISYNREDQHRARGIAAALEAEGLSVWWDSNLRAGQSYDEVTEKNLREAGAVVVLWSKRSVASKWVRAEATIGERSSTLVPAMIEECDRPLRFELVQAADLIQWHGDQSDPNWRTFVKDIKSAIGHTEKAPAASTGAAGAAPNGDVTIENTFWTSIKDGKDRSDFEAYLNRYPDGHFADLARNRLAALDQARAKERAETRSAAAQAGRTGPAPAPPARKAPEPTAPSRPSTDQKRPAPAAATAKPRPAPQRASTGSPAKSGPGAMVFALVGLFVLALGAAAYFFMQPSGGDGEEQPPENVAASNEPTSSTTEGIAAVDADNGGGGAAAATAPDAAVNSETAQLNETPYDSPDEAGGSVEDLTNAAPEAPLETADEEIPAPAVSDTFSDCEACPTMRVLQGGKFMMGSPEDEAGRYPYEGPRHEVNVAPFAIGVHEVTFDQWAACVEGGGCGGYTPGDAGYGRGSRPAIYISWRDAKSYADWLSRKTGRTYRLPSEAEWEFAARGGEPTRYWWGDAFDANQVARGGTKPVEETAANPFGIYGILGNASEWVEDCYVNNYNNAPIDGAPLLSGDCGRRVTRGGNWRSDPRDMRSANRRRITATVRDRTMGFRVAADVE